MRNFLLAAVASTANATTNAFVDQCDNNGVIEMKARMRKSTIGPIAPAGFADVTGDFYEATFSQADLTASFDGDDWLVMTKSIAETYAVQVKDKNGADLTVYKQTGHSITLTCKYSLADQNLEEKAFTVGGSDFKDDSVGIGTLGYELEMVEDCSLEPTDCTLYKIGSTAGFTITPDNPGLVFAEVKNCEVHRGGNHVQIIGEYGDMCLNKFLKAQLTVWSSKQTLQGSFTAFKWSTTVGDADPEEQKLHCTIGLSKTISTTTPNDSCVDPTGR